MRSVFIALALALFVSCKGPILISVTDYPELSQPLNVAWPFIASHDYIPHPGADFKTPEQFEADGGGDCADFAANLVYQLGREASYIVIEEARGHHAIVEYRGSYIEPQIYKKYYDPAKLTITQRESYSRVMLLISQ